MPPSTIKSENRSGGSTRANTKVWTKPMTQAPPAVVTRSNKYGIEIKRSGGFSTAAASPGAGSIVAFMISGSDRERLFACGDIGKACDHAPIVPAREPGELLVDIPDDGKRAVVAVAVKRLHHDVAIADRFEHRAHLCLIGDAPRIARRKHRI